MSLSNNQETFKSFSIPLKVDRKYCGEALRAVLSTILFLRLFGSLTPQTGEAVGISYPKIINEDIESLLDSKAREISRSAADTSVKTLGVLVNFYDRRAKKNAWFPKTKNYCWESWRLDLEVSSPQPSESPAPPSTGNYNTEITTDTASRKAVSNVLQRVLMEVVSSADNHKEHIPPITTTNVAPFPYEINIV